MCGSALRTVETPHPELAGQGLFIVFFSLNHVMSGSDEYLKHVQSPHDHQPKMSSVVEIPTTTLLKVLALSLFIGTLDRQ